jgi:hypothetical protein
MKRILKRNVFNKEKLSKWAASVKKRDGFSCRACGYTGYLHSHHILPKSKFPKYVYCVWNGVTLCKLCHLGKSGVHRKSKPRNKTVRVLRDFLKTGSVDSVKCFTKSFSKNKNVRPRIKKIYRPYSSFKKRKP